MTPYLDDSPRWWNALLLPPLVILLVVGYVVTSVADWFRRLFGA